ncbi:MAG: hypothetical protein JWQ23_2275 [Herminiimonas sp.]|nr:hypothetical protein [Herminiimonas sp.]
MYSSDGPVASYDFAHSQMVNLASHINAACDEINVDGTPSMRAVILRYRLAELLELVELPNEQKKSELNRILAIV